MRKHRQKARRPEARIEASTRELSQIVISALQETMETRSLIKGWVSGLSDELYWRLQGRLMDTLRLQLWSAPDCVQLSEVMLSTGMIPAWALRDLEAEEPLTIMETQACDEAIERDENASPLAEQFRSIREAAARRREEEEVRRNNVRAAERRELGLDADSV